MKHWLLSFVIVLTFYPFNSIFGFEKDLSILTNPCIATQDTISINDTLVIKKKKPWFERLAQMIDFNNPDPRYISSNLYNFTFMVNTTGSYEHYRMSSFKGDKQSISFAPSPSWKLGAYFGWRWIFVGWSVDVNDLFGGKHKRKKNEFNLSLYSAKVGIDLYFLKSQNNVKIRDISGFANADKYKGYNFDGLQSEMKGVNLYYIFNNRHFSYPAAYSQSTNQRKSAGSFLAGLSYSNHKLFFDTKLLPDWIDSQLQESMRFHKIHYTDYSINFGYGYNWVFAKNYLANLSITPALGYKESNIYSEQTASMKDYHTINCDIITRAALVYNNTKYYIGASLLVQTYNFHKKPFWLSNTYGILQFYVGFNFNKK